MDPRARFCELIARPDAEIPLAEAALCIAAEARPSVDVDRWLAELDGLADRVAPRVSAAVTPAEKVTVLNHALFVDEGFVGNRSDYGDPLNSFLDAVIERRTGIPITLSLVFVEVARRIGLEASGIGFPGHFLARVESSGPPIIVDAFYGQTLSLVDCAERLRQVAGDTAQFEAGLLASAPHAEILRRMLANLKLVYVSAGDPEAALGCCERILLIAPEDPTELRDRGLVLRELDCPAAALADLERFLALAPDHPSAPAVRELLEDVRSEVSPVH